MTIAVRRIIECPTCATERGALLCLDGVNCRGAGTSCEYEHPAPARADVNRGVYTCAEDHVIPMATHVMLDLQGAPRLFE